MLICGICGLASHLDSCPLCGASLKDKLESGEQNDLKDIFSKDVELPFDLQTPSVNISNVPAFGLDDSPMPDKVENVSENDEKSPFLHKIPFGINDEPKQSMRKNIIFGLDESPDLNE